MFSSFFGKNSSSTPNTSSILAQLKAVDTTAFKSKVKILLVDDEEYRVFHHLKNREYNIFEKRDIDYLIEVEPYDIAIFDINGVASKYGSPKSGLGFAIDAKRKYPHKCILSYSGDLPDAESLRSINELGIQFIKKDTDVDIWDGILQRCIREYLSIDYHWNIIEKTLDQNTYSAEVTKELKHIYEECYVSGSFDKFVYKYSSFGADPVSLLGVISSIITIKTALLG